MDYREKFAVKPGAKLSLAHLDAGDTAPFADHKHADDEIAAQLARLERLQYLLYAGGDQSVLIVLQALDAGGKDGLIRHLFAGLNPQGTRLHAFAAPTPQEAAHDFLWRVHRRAPAAGEVAIFNRSHYEEVLAARVRRLVPPAVWSKRYGLINDFERMLAESRTRILKFYLHITPDEQLARFKERLDNPDRRWKIAESDYADRALWTDYAAAYEDALAATSTDWAPWYIVPANHKWFRNLAVSQIVADTLDAMGLRTPPARVDIAEIRRKYHAAAQAAGP